jgi:hypothetical protein
MLRFAFATGVTRYAVAGVSEGFNQLTDITLNPMRASIRGFTPEEIDLYFGERYPEILKTSREKGYLSTKLLSSYASSHPEQSRDLEYIHALPPSTGRI